MLGDKYAIKLNVDTAGSLECHHIPVAIDIRVIGWHYEQVNRPGVGTIDRWSHNPVGMPNPACIAIYPRDPQASLNELKCSRWGSYSR